MTANGTPAFRVYQPRPRGARKEAFWAKAWAAELEGPQAGVRRANPAVLEARLGVITEKVFPMDWRLLPAVGVEGDHRGLPQPPASVRPHEEPAEHVWRYAQEALFTQPMFVLRGIHQTVRVMLQAQNDVLYP